MISIRIRRIAYARRWTCMSAFLLLFACSSSGTSAIDSLRIEIAKTSLDSNKVNLLIELSKEYMSEDLDMTLGRAQEALDLSKKIGFTAGEASAYRYMGLSDYLSGRYGDAVSHWQLSRQKYESVGDFSNVARLYSNIGAVYFNQSDYSKAIEYYLESKKICEKTNDLERLMSVLQNLGAVHGVKPQTYDKALEYYKEALTVGEGIDDDYTKGTISANMAEIILAQKESLIVTKQDSLDYLKLTANPDLYHNFPDVIRHAVKNDSLAIDFFQQARQYYLGTPDETYAIRGLGKVYKDKKEYSKALELLNMSLEMAEIFEQQLDVSQSLLHIANVYQGAGNYDLAIEYFLQAKELAKDLELKEDQKLIFEGLSKCYKRKNDFSNSILYYDSLIAIKDTLYNIEFDRKMSGQLFNYEIEKKEDEIALQEAETDKQKLQKNASLLGLGLILAIAFVLMKMYRDKVKTNKLLDEQKDQIETLLLNTLPAEVVRELEEFGVSKPKEYERVSVLFTDFKGFTTLAADLTPTELVEELTLFFTAFDDIMGKYGIEKIKTIGDAYMCAGGVPNHDPDHPVKIIRAGLEIQAYMQLINEKRAKTNLPAWELRVGIHTGPVIAGVVGKKKYAYDIWGSTVNTASRMESNGEPGRVNISNSTYNIVKDTFPCVYRGKISAKNIGEIDMYFVDVELPLSEVNRELLIAS